MSELFDCSEVRHRLHQLAEPSGEEFQTHRFILDSLVETDPARIHTFDNSLNILAVYEFGNCAQTLLFRGDFDAVRVDETISPPYASLTPGVSHKCGHDGHATILLGLAHQLKANPVKNKRILLFFQAAEETGNGAKQLMDTKILNRYQPDKVFALHNIPGEQLGTVLCKPDSFTCSVVSCDIELHGHTSHAAEPLKAVCPYAAAKRIADKVLELNCYRMESSDFRLATLVEFRIGEQAYGVAAGHGVLRFTLRAKEDALLQQTKSEIVQIVDQVVAEYDGVSSRVEWKEYFAAAKNQDAAVKTIQAAAAACALPCKHLEQPFSWGEDFGLLTQYYPGALFGLGAGIELSPLHHQHFDFPDDLLPVGIRLFYWIANE